MLQKLNERIQGVIAWLVIILIAITFTLFGVDYYLQSRQTSNAKVLVNDKPITNQAFEVSYRRARSQQDFAQMTATDEKKLQNKVLNQMIMNEVTIQSAQKSGFEVSADQADAAIVTIPQFQQDGHFSTERYQQALNGALFTPETFQKEVRQGMLLNQQRFAFMGSSFALPSEIKRFVRLYMQTRDYDYLTIPASHFLNMVQVSADEIQKFYKQHQKEFLSPEQVSLSYILLSINDIKKNIKVTEEDIKKYYDENQNNYLTPAQWQVAHILFAVPEHASKEEEAAIKVKAQNAYQELEKNPKQFDKLVSTLSDDKLSIANKGILPWISGSQTEYVSSLTELTKPGQISEPLRTKHGYEIYKLLAYKPVSTKSLNEVQSMIKDQIVSDLAQNEYAQRLEQLSDLSYQSPDSLVPAADALNIPIRHTELFSKAGGNTPLTKNRLVINTAFSHDVLGLANNSEPLQIDNDSVLVLRVKKHVSSKQQSLEVVTDKIKNILKKQLAEAKAKELGVNLLNPVEDKEQEKLLSSHHLQWQSVTKASRDNDNVHLIINDTAFNLLRPENRDGISMENGDYVVVRLRHINDGELSTLDEEQKDSLAQQIEASYGMMDYDLYVNHLINQAQIVRH